MIQRHRMGWRCLAQPNNQVLEYENSSCIPQRRHLAIQYCRKEFPHLWLRLLGSGVNLSGEGAGRLVLQDGQALLEAGQAAPHVLLGRRGVAVQLGAAQDHEGDVELVQDDAYHTHRGERCRVLRRAQSVHTHPRQNLLVHIHCTKCVNFFLGEGGRD